jgi:hypothetical protein
MKGMKLTESLNHVTLLDLQIRSFLDIGKSDEKINTEIGGHSFFLMTIALKENIIILTDKENKANK